MCDQLVCLTSSHCGRSMRKRYLFRLENDCTAFLVNLFGKYGDVHVDRSLIVIDAAINKFLRLSID